MAHFFKKLFFIPLTLLCFLTIPSLHAETLTQDQIDEMTFRPIGVGLCDASNLIGAALNVVTNSEWSHAGFVMCDASQDPTDRDHWYFFETTGTPGEVFQGKYPHARVNPLAEMLEDYDGHVAYRR